MVTAASEEHNLELSFEKLSIANTEDENLSILTDLRLALMKNPADIVCSAVTNSVLESFIRKASTFTSIDCLDLCRDVLNRFFACVPAEVFLTKFHAEILLALSSDSIFVKNKFLQAIKQAIEDCQINNIANILEVNSPLLIAVARSLNDYEISVYSDAKAVFVALVTSDEYAKILFNSDLVMSTVKEMLRKNDVIRFRMHEWTADICYVSPQVLKYCLDAGFMSELLNEMDSRDFLCQLNAIEILTQMAAGSRHFLEYFHESGILNKLYEFLSNAQDSPDATFLFPAVMKFFGHLARLYPKECCDKYPKFLTAVFQLVLNFELLEVAQRLLAFDTLGLLASTAEGKIVLSTHDREMQRCLPIFGQAIRGGPFDMRIRHLEALSDLLKLEVPNQAEDLLKLTEKWFYWLDKSPVQVILGIFKQPFANIQCAGGEVLKRIAVQPWGQRLICQEPGFLEYLLNRNLEASPDGRYIKFEIVELLVKSPFIHENIDSALFHRLQQFYKEGPYYVRVADADVATE